MNPSSVDEPGGDSASLRTLGEILAATASLELLSGLIARALCGATRARRVALFARDDEGRLAAVADAAGAEAAADMRVVLALPLLVGRRVHGVVVAQDAGDPEALRAFVPQAAQAVAAAREMRPGDGGPRARISGQALHEVNNRLGAIQIYAYLLTERLRRGTDASGLEVAGKLSSAVDRLGTTLAGLAPQDASPPGARSATDLDALIDGCVAAAAAAGGSGRVVRREAGAGSVPVHAATLTDALRLVLREVGGSDPSAPPVVVSARRLPNEHVEIAVEGPLDARRLADALFAGESSPLGRAVLRDVVESEAAAVSVAAAVGGGAAIRVELGGVAG